MLFLTADEVRVAEAADRTTACSSTLSHTCLDAGELAGYSGRTYDRPLHSKTAFSMAPVSRTVPRRAVARIRPVAPGDVQLAFAQAAAADGIVLGSQSFDWLCEQGHVGLERVAKVRRDPALVGPVTAALETLDAIYARLKGDISVLYASRENLLLPVDLVHEPTGTVVEVDESPHFTSFRLATLELYPADVTVGFDLDEHKELCRAWCSRTDGLARGLAARGFGFGGVQRERAYHDALRDLATPAMGHPPVIRIVAVDGDGTSAYQRHRASLLTLRAS